VAGKLRLVALELKRMLLQYLRDGREGRKLRRAKRPATLKTPLAAMRLEAERSDERLGHCRLGP
jgi:hypothetical protein